MTKDAGELFRQGFRELNDAAIVVRYHAPRTPHIIISSSFNQWEDAYNWILHIQRQGLVLVG